MKKYPLPLLFLLASHLLWIQAAAQNVDELDMSDVVVIEDVEPTPTENTEAPVAVVEIPESEVEGASIDVEAPAIPEATEPLPGETEVVLEIPGQEDQSLGEATMASEEKISVDFPDEDVRTILRNVADLFDLNLVIPDTLQGRTSIKLKRVTWQEVFEVVLEPLGYTYVTDRNIIRIRNYQDLASAPLDRTTKVLEYADAETIRPLISQLVDPSIGGSVSVDKRTNALLIIERPERINSITSLISELDKAEKQVMIESRFVEVSQTDERDIGVNWSFIDDRPNALLQENSVSSFDPSDTLQNSLENNGLLAVFSRQEFGVVLSALDQNDTAKLVSQPTVVVMNNETAKFRVGVDYPTREITFNPQAEQGQSQYEAGELKEIFIGIDLEVTPKVAGTESGDIFLNIDATLSELGGAGFPDFVEVQQIGSRDPVLSTREANTKVTVKDGFTIAIGGLVSENRSTADDGIPVLKDLPGIGKLFKKSNSQQSRSNLIIFITARMLNESGATYRDIIDPRVLNDIGHTERKTPGYGNRLSQEDAQLLLEAEKIREARELEEFKEQVERRFKKSP